MPEDHWKLDDPYKHAPRRREGDPWKVLLDPLLEKEKIQCDGWKDEVGNLLIFAGLFSAVLTAFIIDSYKTLQPSDNKDIIALLSQIASNQFNNNTVIPTSNQIQLPSQTFTAPASAVRINTLWFLSLVFSLAAVLVGIIALQWLRQYQAFPGQSPREALALYSMREEGMRRWHVWKILMALPVLLQAALVLFLWGLLDFLWVLTIQEGRVIFVCVTVAAGATMLFVVGTMTLPALQTLFLPLRMMMMLRSRNSNGKRTPPSQCPYKSPQSILFCGLVNLLFRGCAATMGWLRSGSDGGGDKEKGSENAGRRRSRLGLSKQISVLWSKSSWIEFDLIWLRARDMCVHAGRFLSHDAAVHADVYVLWAEELGIDVPLYDTLRLFKSFTSVSGSVQTLALPLSSEVVNAAYHCLAEISGGLTIGKLSVGDVDLEVVKEWSRYLRYLCHEQSETSEFIADKQSSSDTIRLLHDQNLCLFLDQVAASNGGDTSIWDANQMLLHRKELKLRIQLYMLQQTMSISQRGIYPTYLEFSHDGSLWKKFPDQEREFANQCIHIITKTFAYFSEDLPISSTDLHSHKEARILIEECVHAISDVTASALDEQTAGNLRSMLVHMKKWLNSADRSLALTREGGSKGDGGHRSGAMPEGVMNLLYCVGLISCGCIGADDRSDSLWLVEEVHVKLKGMLQNFRDDVGNGRQMMSGEEEKLNVVIMEVEKRLKEAKKLREPE